jgi:hypothetical protein
MTEIRFPKVFCPSPASGPERGTAERWLASAHPSPDIALGEWSSAAKLAVLPSRSCTGQWPPLTGTR